jgi:hypothetical protein
MIVGKMYREFYRSKNKFQISHHNHPWQKLHNNLRKLYRIKGIGSTQIMVEIEEEKSTKRQKIEEHEETKSQILQDGS